VVGVVIVFCSFVHTVLVLTQYIDAYIHCQYFSFLGWIIFEAAYTTFKSGVLKVVYLKLSTAQNGKGSRCTVLSDYGARSER
jgi:hypothetical protein